MEIEAIRRQISQLAVESKNPVHQLTEVRQSHIAGLGLFAKSRIPKGTIWWKADPNDILMVNREQFKILMNSIQSPLIEEFVRSILIYAYYSAAHDALVLCLDNARFVNHSFTPNSGSDEFGTELVAVAVRDIEEGEEMTENYANYDQCPWADLWENFMNEDKPDCQ